MKKVDLFQETLLSLSANKSRSVLTILGIVIGIGSVITMISIGQGAAADISSQIQSLGSNLLVVSPGSANSFGPVRGGAGSATTLVNDDAEAIATQIQNIAALAPTVSSRKQVIASGTNTNTNIYGVSAEYVQVKNIELTSGTFINATHNDKLSKVAVLGPDVSEELFGEGIDPIGKKIKIESMEFTVIGVTVSKGGTGFDNTDTNIYIPIATAQKYILGNDSLSNINIQVTTEELMTTVQKEITSLLLTRHKIVDAASADFSVINQADLISAVSSVSDTLTLLLGAIAGISLLVGGIGIMNMMLTSVTERTREIGLRKSLGAKNFDINIQFLVESISLTFIGGVIGISLGIFAAYLVTKISGTTTDVTSTSVLLAFGVSALIGILFGYYPARRAAKLNPIEALRYE
jgi:putative ABC transport system permease protein